MTDRVEITPQTNSRGLPINPTRPLVIGLVVLMVGFGGFLVWALLAQLDEGIPVNATVTLDTRRRTLQHLSGGVLKEISVRDGDSVREGQVLLRFDESTALASKSISESQLRATEIQIQHLSKLIRSLEPLVREGYYPANRLLELRRDLAEAQATRAGNADRLAAAQSELERTVIRSPADGKIMAIQVSTIGGVVTPGGKLLDLVPEDEELVIEAQIPPHLIEGVGEGLEAQVLFPALKMRVTPTISGVVKWVSPDKISDPNDPNKGSGYFIARVIVSQAELSKLGDVSLRSGMPAEVILRTGQRTFFQYLIKPLTDRMATSLKER